MTVSEAIKELRKLNPNSEVGIFYQSIRLCVDKPVKIREVFVVDGIAFESQDDAIVELNNEIAIRKKYPEKYNNNDYPKLEKVICFMMDWD